MLHMSKTTKNKKAAKNIHEPLTLAEVNEFATTLGVFFSRLRATVAEAERGREVQARMARVSILLSPDGRMAAESSQPNGAANGSGKMHSIRRPLPIDRAAIVGVVRRAGKAGVTAGEIADKLHLEVRRLRPVLWQIRDAGELRATGKLSTTRYHLPVSALPKNRKSGAPASEKERTASPS